MRGGGGLQQSSARGSMRRANRQGAAGLLRSAATPCSAATLLVTQAPLTRWMPARTTPAPILNACTTLPGTLNSNRLCCLSSSRAVRPASLPSTSAAHSSCSRHTPPAPCTCNASSLMGRYLGDGGSSYRQPPPGSMKRSAVPALTSFTPAGNCGRGRGRGRRQHWAISEVAIRNSACSYAMSLTAACCAACGSCHVLVACRLRDHAATRNCAESPGCRTYPPTP